jgi:ATP synthase F1, delta subunit
MNSRDAAPSAFDPVADAIKVDEAAADELFAVVDLLEAQPPLRRSLSDPSASAVDRQALARRLFESRLGAAALSVVTEAASRPWSSGRIMIEAIERQGVRGLLRVANERGELKRVQDELHQFVMLIDGSPELSDALRNRGRSIADRRALITRLLADRVAPVTERLTSRAAAARVRTVPLTLSSYLALAADLAGEKIARVTVARPLDQGRTERLRRALEARVGGPVLLQIEVDENLIGGMSVDLGAQVFESTVAGRLNEARRLLN